MDIQKVIELLGDGHSQVIVADALGVSPARINQLLESEEVRAKVAARKISKLTDSSKMDSEWDALESRAMNKMKMSLALATKPMEIAKILQIANAAKRKAIAADTNAGNGHAVQVTLVLPGIVHHKFAVAAQTNEIVEIDGQSLVTVSSDTISRMPMREVPTNEPKRLAPADSLETIKIPTITGALDRARQEISAADL